MTTDQLARFQAYSLALAHLSENEELLKTVPALFTAYQTAKATSEAIAEAQGLRQQNREGVLASKNQFVQAIGREAMTISRAIVSYASVNKEDGLKETMSFTRSEFVHSGAAELGTRASNILATARMLNGKLMEYGITEEKLSSFEAMVKQYVTSANLPRIDTTDRKNARLKISELMKQLQEQMDNQVDALLLQFEEGHADFYNKYQFRRKVVNPGHRKTRLEGLVLEDGTGNPLGEVQVLIKESILTTLTLSDGTYSLKTPPMTGATVVFMKEGYEPFTIVLDIRRGQAVNQTVSLVKKQ